VLCSSCIVKMEPDILWVDDDRHSNKGKGKLGLRGKIEGTTV